MKNIKLLSIAIAVSIFCVVISSCSKKQTCDFCGDIAKCKEKEVWDEIIYLCEDCLDNSNEELFFDSDFIEEPENEEIKVPVEHKTVDVFADVQISFEGISGQGTASINNTSTDGFVSQVKFYLDEENSSSVQYNLSNGDVITIVASCDENLMDEYLKKPLETVKTFVVSGLPISVSSKDLSRDLIEQIKQYAYEIILKHAENEARYYEYDNITYKCTYFYDNEYRNDYYTPDTPKTELVVFFSCDRTDFYDNNTVKTVYCGVSFSSGRGEMVLYSDGSYKILSGSSSYDINADCGVIACFEETLEEAVESICPLFEDETYYTKTKID